MKNLHLMLTDSFRDVLIYKVYFYKIQSWLQQESDCKTTLCSTGMIIEFKLYLR